VLARGGGHHRSQLFGDALLADEEGREPVHPLAALVGSESLPVLAVAREVELLREPLLPLPQLVELLVVEELDLAPVGRLEQRRVGALGEELAELNTRSQGRQDRLLVVLS